MESLQQHQTHLSSNVSIVLGDSAILKKEAVRSARTKQNNNNPTHHTKLTSQLTPGPGCHQTSSTAERAKSNRKPSNATHRGRQNILSGGYALPRGSWLFLANYRRSVNTTTGRVHPSHTKSSTLPLHTYIQDQRERTAGRWEK